MSNLGSIDTIVFVMLENRSFDHMLGHLSYGSYANGTPVNGLKDPLHNDLYENVFEGQTYYPFPKPDEPLSCDLPHERREIAVELAKSQVSGRFTMSGFVKAYYEKQAITRVLTPDPMAFLKPEAVPVTRFFADQYAVCDHWFAPLPASTQPNRLMALSGSTRIDQTSGIFPPTDPLIIDWLEAHHVRWRVYHSGISFFALLGRTEIFGPNFRTIRRLAPDVMGEQPGDFPSVIIVEPSYGDAPHIGHDVPNDNHPPLPVGPGEAFLHQIYEALTCNPKRWSRTLLIVTYDEHGGFFDHVAPPPIPYKPLSNATFTAPFDSLGVRVPALLISPLIPAKTVHSLLLDHTSVLQLLCEKFGSPGESFSQTVENRRQAGITSVSQALTLDAPRTDIPRAPDPPRPNALSLEAEGLPGAKGPQSPMEAAYAETAKWMVDKYPRQTAQQYPEISHWVLTQDSGPGT